MPLFKPSSLRDVVALMCVRKMPETEFADLCDRLLAGAAITESATLGLTPILHSDAPARTGAQTCELCDGPVEAEKLNGDCLKATGVRACKACIDRALVALWGPEPEADALVRHALGFAAGA